MKKLIIFALLLALPASATLTNQEKAFFEYKNLLNNPGAESGKAGVTASAGTFTINTTSSNVYAGAASFSWDGSATGQTLTGPATTLPTSGQCLVKTRFKTTETTVPYELEAYDGTNVLVTTTLTGTSAWALGQASFPCPASGTVRWRVRTNSSAGNPAVIYLDDLYLGQDYNFALTSQAGFVGAAVYPAVSNCAWSSSTTYGNFTADSDCTSPTGSNLVGTALAPSTKVPGGRFTNLSRGRYMVIAHGQMQKFTAGDNRCSFRLHDGTNALVGESAAGSTPSVASASTEGVGVVIGTIEYTNTQSDVTFQVQSSSSGGAACGVNAVTTPFSVSVYRFPNSTETAMRPDLVGQTWAGYHGTDCSYSRTNTALGDFGTDASCTLTETQNVNFGTVTVASGTLPGITWTPTKAGKFYVCATPIAFVDTAMAIATLRLTDGTTTVVDTSYRPDTNGVNSAASSIPLCGVYSVASAGTAVTLKLQGSQSSGALGIASNGNTRSAIEWSIIDVTQSLPAPLLVGSVTSSSSGIERIERVVTSNADCASSPCTIDYKTSGINTVTRSSAGTYLINFVAGTFSGPPVCIANAGRGGGRICQVSTPSSSCTSTSCVITCNASTTAALQDADPHAICMGPR